MPTDPPREPDGILLRFAKAIDTKGARSHDEHVRAALAIERAIEEHPSPKGTPNAD